LKHNVVESDLSDFFYDEFTKRKIKKIEHDHIINHCIINMADYMPRDLWNIVAVYADIRNRKIMRQLGYIDMSGYETDLVRGALQKYTKCDLDALDALLARTNGFLFGEFIVLALTPGDGMCELNSAHVRVCVDAPSSITFSDVRIAFPLINAEEGRTKHVANFTHASGRIIEFVDQGRYSYSKIPIHIHYQNGGLNDISSIDAQIVDIRRFRTIGDVYLYSNTDWRKFQYDAVRSRNRIVASFCCQCDGRVSDLVTSVKCRRCEAIYCRICLMTLARIEWMQTRNCSRTFCYACSRSAQLLGIPSASSENLITASDLPDALAAYIRFARQYGVDFKFSLLIMPTALSSDSDSIRISIPRRLLPSSASSSSSTCGNMYLDVLSILDIHFEHKNVDEDYDGHKIFKVSESVLDTRTTSVEISRLEPSPHVCRLACRVEYDQNAALYTPGNDTFMVLNGNGLVQYPKPC